MKWEKTIRKIERSSIEMKDGVFLDTDDDGNVVVKEETTDGDEKIISDKYCRFLLCSERCARKSHYGTLYILKDGTQVFVCNFFPIGGNPFDIFTELIK